MARTCCQELVTHTPAQPFTRVLGLSWDEGMSRGVMVCGACGNEFLFEATGEDEDESRTYELSPLPDGTLVEIVEMLEEYLDPEWPVWAPDWDFGTLEVRTSLEESIEELLEEADSGTLRVLWSTNEPSVLAAHVVDDD